MLTIETTMKEELKEIIAELKQERSKLKLLNTLNSVRDLQLIQWKDGTFDYIINGKLIPSEIYLKSKGISITII